MVVKGSETRKEEEEEEEEEEGEKEGVEDGEPKSRSSVDTLRHRSHLSYHFFNISLLS